MQNLPEIRSWRENIDAESAERQIRWLREKIASADKAIEAQQRIIASDGPLEGYLLSMESLRKSQLKLESKLADLMKEREVEVMDFALDGKRYSNHSAQAKSLSLFLHAIQNLYERIGYALSMPNAIGSIPPHIRQLCMLEVAGFFPSSFGIRFTTHTCVDLTGSSLANSALEATFDLVNSSNPVEQAARVGQRAMNQYRHLVNTLIKVEATPKVNWRTPAGEDRSWIANDNDLLALSNRLAHIRDMAPKTLEATGVLTGASLRRQKFEFDGGRGVITGKAPREMADKITHHFGKPCRITYVETLFIDETTEQEKRARVLIDIVQV